MSRVVERVDAVVAAWLTLRTTRPEEALDAIVGRFSGMSGRLGYFLAESGVRATLGDQAVDGLEELGVDEHGVLGGRVVDDACTPNLMWERGTLSIWRRQAAMPDSAIATLVGRRLGTVAVHPLLPADAVVATVSENDAWLRIGCTGWHRDIEGTRTALRGASGGRR